MRTTILCSCSFWWSGLILESSLEIALRSISNKPGACFAVNSFMAAGSYSGQSLLVWWYSASWNFPTSSSRELTVNECRFQHIVIRLYNWQLCYIIKLLTSFDFLIIIIFLIVLVFEQNIPESTTSDSKNNSFILSHVVLSIRASPFGDTFIEPSGVSSDDHPSCRWMLQISVTASSLENSLLNWNLVFSSEGESSCIFSCSLNMGDPVNCNIWNFN